jgi:hypothetical protein
LLFPKGMESGVHKKFISLYWITWIVLLAAPVVSAWGSQTAGDAAKPQKAQTPPCEEQQCMYASARDQLVFQFIYHSEYAKQVEKFDDAKVQGELMRFCAGVVPGPNETREAACKKTYLQTLRVNLENTRVEIHRMNDALARLHSGTAQFSMPAKLDAQGKPIKDQPRIPEPLELNEFKKLIASSVDSKAQEKYEEWVKSQPQEPLPHHFPKLLSYQVTDRDGTKRDMVMIDRSCPKNPGSECYDLVTYQSVLKAFRARLPADLRPALTHSNMSKAADGMYSDALKTRETAYQAARIQVNSAVNKVLYGFDKSDQAPVRALASQPVSRKKSASKVDINVFMKDEDMRKAIDSIQF